MIEEKNIKNPAVMAEPFELPYCTSSTMLESERSHWGRKHNTVLFQKAAIPAAKTGKNCPRVTFTSDNGNRMLFLMFFPRMQSVVRHANPLMARPLYESFLRPHWWQASKPSGSQAQTSEAAMRAVGPRL